MTIGSSIFMIVAGAILRYAVTWHIHGVDLPALGLILAIAGIITLVIRLIWLLNPDIGERQPPVPFPVDPAGQQASDTRLPSPARQPPPPGSLPGWSVNSAHPSRGRASRPIRTGPDAWLPTDDRDGSG